ncbi:MAG: RNA methyltransferase [Anaerolinea sp.]|nr:RNA methyltransferase [Anaerolinea sp.]
MITSIANPQIKYFRKLKNRKYRNETGMFLVEGTRIVIEALEESKNITDLIVARELLRNENAKKAVKDAESKGIPLVEVSTEVFESLSTKDGPQGLAAIVRQNWHSLEEISGTLGGVWIALYEVSDPGNLGTIIRTLDGMGGEGVILIDQCTDPFDPSAIRASMGAIFAKKIIKTDLTSFEKWVRQKNVIVVGTSDSAERDYENFNYPRNLILLMGSEREGLPDALAKICHSIVAIPMEGKSDSLNLSVASSIILYEIYNQHRKIS